MDKKEVKELITQFKEENTALINSSAFASANVYFGHRNHTMGDACFARLKSRIREMPETKSDMFYLLYYDKTLLFNYDKLFKELRTLFGNYFKILRYVSGNEKVRIVYIGEEKEFQNPALKYSAYFLLLVMLRSIDGEFRNKWTTYFKTNSKEIDNWYDIIYKYYIDLMVSGHGINDAVQQVACIISGGYMSPYANKSPELVKYTTKDTNKESMECIVNEFLSTLRKAFGKRYNWEEKAENLATPSGQTPTFYQIWKEVK